MSSTVSSVTERVNLNAFSAAVLVIDGGDDCGKQRWLSDRT